MKRFSFNKNEQLAAFIFIFFFIKKQIIYINKANLREKNLLINAPRKEVSFHIHTLLNKERVNLIIY